MNCLEINFVVYSTISLMTRATAILANRMHPRVIDKEEGCQERVAIDSTFVLVVEYSANDSCLVTVVLW